MFLAKHGAPLISTEWATSVQNSGTKNEEDRGAFKTPTRRDVARTAPYMHDGSLKTLMEVIDYYDKGGTPNPHLSSDMRPLQLTEQEKADLVEFMKSLSGEMPAFEEPKLPN